MSDEIRTQSALARDYHQPNPDAERHFLSGKHKHDQELAKLGRVFLEFVRSFQHLGELGKCVTVFGSARFEEDHHYYEMARKLGRRLAEEETRETRDAHPNMEKPRHTPEGA